MASETSILAFKAKAFSKSLRLIMKEQIKCRLGVVQEQKATLFKQKEP